MVEQQESAGEQTEGKSTVTNPPPAPHVESPPLHGKHEESPAQHPADQSHTKSKKPLDLLGRLTLSEWLTFFVGLGSLAVAFLAWRTASDSTDIKSAIGNLSTLADQTKRQADALGDQLVAIKDQVGALRDQTEEAKRQTKAIASQTEAIKASSDAAIRSAEAATAAAVAEKKMADVTADAQKPAPDLFNLQLTGLKGQPDANGLIHPDLTWQFRNVGGSAFTVKEVYWGLYEGASLPDSMPSDGIHTEGVGIVVINNNMTSVFALNNQKLEMTKERADAAVTGGLFYFAKMVYFDTHNVEHMKCFGRQVFFENGSSIVAKPSGGIAYQCAS